VNPRAFLGLVCVLVNVSALVLSTHKTWVLAHGALALYGALYLLAHMRKGRPS
jgi:hypothetical protein